MIVHTIRILEGEALDVEWIRLKQIPGVTPPEFEQQRLVERYTSPPETVWEAQLQEEEEEKKEAPHG